MLTLFVRPASDERRYSVRPSCAGLVSSSKFTSDHPAYRANLQFKCLHKAQLRHLPGRRVARVAEPSAFRLSDFFVFVTCHQLIT
jgi:CRISPR/Cas system endoribonuclease Cas6 (RAMP superfamily)